MDIGAGLGIAGVVAAGGIAVAFWRQAVGVCQQLSQYVIGRAELEYDAARILCSYLRSSRRLPSVRSRRFAVARWFVRSKRRHDRVIYEDLFSTTAVVFRGWVPVLISQKSETENRRGFVYVSWLRGTLDIDVMLRDAAAHINELEHSSARSRRFRVIRRFGSGSIGRRIGKTNNNEPGEPAGYSSDRSEFENVRQGAAVPVSVSRDDIEMDYSAAETKPFEVYSFSESTHAFVNEIRAWHSSGDWYRERGIPWARGWLLHGPPGSGKTILLRALAQELDMPVFAFDLASMSNEEFVEAWDSVSGNTPCMVVLEDIDSVFHGRENIVGEMGGGLTFDCVLNCISGVRQSDGVFVAFTTNDLTKVDPAIGQDGGGGVTSRPGRVDRVIELGAMEEPCRRRHARRVLGRDGVEDLVMRGEGMMAAQFNDLCVREALENFWKSPPAGGHVHRNGLSKDDLDFEARQKELREVHRMLR